MSLEPLTLITIRELWLLQAGVSALEVSEPRGEALFLQVDTSGRRWRVESPTGRLAIDVADARPTNPVDGARWIRVSERIRRFAHLLECDEVQLSIADGQTVVVGDGDTTAAVDMVNGTRGDPRPLSFRAHATAVVSLQDFAMLMNAARGLPVGVMDSGDRPMPIMWMELDGDSLGLHVDWSAFDAARATYRMAATGTGHTTASIPHVAVEHFLRSVPPFDDETYEVEGRLEVSVGWAADDHHERPALCIASGEWQLLLWLVHPLEERWAATVSTAIDRDASLEIVETDGVEWLVRHGHREVRVVLHHGRPDIARVSTVLVTGIDESMDLLRELSELNASSTGIRYWHDADTVYAVSDVRCGDLASSLTSVLRDVAMAATSYSPMLQTFISPTS